MVAKLLLLLAFVSLAYCESSRQTPQAIQHVENYIDSKRGEINQRYRLLYHVMPPVGWLNDPNGFTYYKSEYHLFYQFYPYDSVWGPMHWGHVVSSDLVNWKYLPTALVPQREMCFSGSAIVENDTLILMYTGRVNYEGARYNETQYLAFSDDGITFRKYEENPVIHFSPSTSPDFRDPKVWKYGDHYYAVIGSRTNDFRGNILLYGSPDLKKWDFLKVLAQSDGDSYMYECPDFFELDGKHVLLLSPQGMTPQGDRYRNVHQTGYIIGTFNYETFEFVHEVDFQELDYGHDFYAAQTTEAYGKRLLVSWFNMWEQHFPEAVDGWTGAMTIVRELRLVGNRITMKPLDAMTTLRDEQKLDGILEPQQQLRFNQTAEILVSGNLSMKIELQLHGIEGGQKAWIRWEPDVGKVVLERGNDDEIRQVEWSPIGTTGWRIFLDTCSIELFCGEGEVVFSSRLYPEGGWLVTNNSPQNLQVQAFSLTPSTSSASGKQVSHFILFLIVLNICIKGLK